MKDKAADFENTLPQVAIDDLQVRQLAVATDLPSKQARELVRRHGNDPKKLEELAKSINAAN
ncbi:hypothetical protein NKH57_12720 [Mesorhizobium sp. M1050]|uniref:hypothetical protein n=1 Tax=unclassified Mesorhizobium TaxID=325217 RepID=UPI0003CE3942|nr:hypothetical protein [Mesorhizobium sp. LNHC252B00]ESY74933.1 hypothetical protein X743_06660 [Mesorhizobium sp. LNHC252B00]